MLRIIKWCVLLYVLCTDFPIGLMLCTGALFFDLFEWFFW